MTQLAFIYKYFPLYRLRRLGKPLLSALFVEVALQQALEAAAMTGLILCHLVDGVVDGVEVQLLGLLGQIHLAGTGTALGVNAHLQVLLGAVGYDFAEKLCEFCCVLCFFVSCFFPV